MSKAARGSRHATVGGGIKPGVDGHLVIHKSIWQLGISDLFHDLAFFKLFEKKGIDRHLVQEYRTFSCAARLLVKIKLVIFCPVFHYYMIGVPVVALRSSFVYMYVGHKSRGYKEMQQE